MAKATRDAYGEILKELGAENPKIVVLDADLSSSTKTAEFKKVFPERHFNCGIAEQNMMGVAAGFATTGKIPFASTFAVFGAGRAYEQIRNSICYPKLNVKIAVTHSGLTVGEDGATHQMLEDISLMRTLPNMTVTVPADAAETKAIIRWAADYEGPVYIRMGRAKVEDVMPEGCTFTPGKATLLRDGADVTLMACGVMVAPALEAAEILDAEGISARVVNMSSIKPIDATAIQEAVKMTGAIVSCEEHNIIGGLGAAIAEVLVQSTPAPTEMVGTKDTFGESGTPDALLEKYGLTAAHIVLAAKRVISRKSRV
ncbi:MAG: transketolase family protein [Negativicoccus succinicivorans]|nr:transketolase family protein [Negativicoccus succinicivorans]